MSNKFSSVIISKDSTNTFSKITSVNDKPLLLNNNIQVGVVNSGGNTNAGLSIKDRGTGNFRDVFVENSTVKFKVDDTTTTSLIREDELETVVNKTSDPLIFSNVHIDMANSTDANKKGIINFFNSNTVVNPNNIVAPVGLRRSVDGKMQFRNESANWIDIPGSSFQVNLTNPTTGQILVYNAGTTRFQNTNFAISADSTPSLGGNLNTNSKHIKFSDNFGIIDNSDNKLLIFDDSNTNANYELLLTKTSTGPKFITNGNNANIDLDIHTKGNGDIKLQTNGPTGDIILSANTHTVMTISSDESTTAATDGFIKLEGLLKIKSGNTNYYDITGQSYSLNGNVDVSLPNLSGNDEFVTLAHTQTLTNKTLTSPVLTTPQINDTSSNHQYIFAVNELVANRTVTLPLLGTDDEFVFKDHAETLTNKTLTSPVLTTPQIKHTSSDHKYIFAGSELAANRTVTLPILGGNDEFVFKNHTQELTNKTLASPVLTTPQISDDSSDHQYIFAVSELADDRTVTLPILGGPDTFVFESHTQTLTNKTINLANNTLTGTKALFNDALSDADFCTLTGSETLTNKGINLANNTLTGTLAEFNNALTSNASFCTLAGSETLTHKTINLANNTLTGTIAQFNTSLSDGTFATTADLDDRVQGLDIKESVKVATTASFTMASTASAITLVLANGEGGFDNSADTLTIDGISLSQNDRVLIKDGVNSASTGVNHKWNGIYTVGALDGTTLTLSRASDAGSNADLTGGTFVFVEQGTVNSNNGFVFTHNGTPTLGTTPLTVSQFSGAGSFIAGTNLSRNGNQLDVDDVFLKNNSDDSTSGTLTAAGFITSGDLDIEGDIDMATGKKITWVNEDTYISGTDTSITIDSDDTLLINSDTTMTLNAGTSMIFDSPSVIYQSSTADKPVFEINNMVNDGTGPILQLGNKRGTNAGVNDDVAGTINFFNNDNANNNQNFGQLKVIASDVTSASEIGKLTIGLACSDDGGIDDILTIVGGTSGQTSSSTIAGELTVQNNTLITNTSHSSLTIKSTNTTNGEAQLNLISDNAADAGDGFQIKSLNGVLTIASDHNSSGTYGETIMTLTGHDTDSSRTTEITGNLTVSENIDMATGKKITWVNDNTYISGTDTGITIESDDTLVVNADTSMTFDSPLFKINDTINDATGPSLQLANKRGTNAGVNDDVAGTINFFNNDNANNNQNFGQIKVIASDVTSTSEIGKMTFGLACSDDGGIDDILTIVGGTSGQTSSSTISGELTVQNNALITNTSHSSLTIKSTNTTNGEAQINLISDNAEDTGDGFQIKSLNGVLTIASDHNSSGTYGETIMTLTGHDTDSSRTTAITGNLNVSGSLSVAGGLSASFDNSTYSSVSSSSTIVINLSSSSNYHIKTNTGLSSLAIVLEVQTTGSMTGKSGQLIIENLTVNPSTISWTTNHGWYFESDSNGDTIIPTLTGVTGAIDIFNYIVLVDSTTESNRKILVTKASHFQSHT